MGDTPNKIKSNTTFISFNCRSVTRSVDCVKSLCKTADIVALQETWLLPHDIGYLGTIDQEFAYFGKSAVDTSAGMLRGRPYGGVAILWRKSMFCSVSVVHCESVRIAAIKIMLDDRQLLVFSLYMPTDTADNMTEFTECLSEISAVIDSCDIDSVFILGDFNAHPSASFGKELESFCYDQNWTCADIDFLGLTSNSYTYISDVHGTRSWLDHVVTTEVASKTIVDIKINYNISWSDHFPVEIVCNLNVLIPKVNESKFVPNTVIWGERNTLQKKKYCQSCTNKLRAIDFPTEFEKCSDFSCNNLYHKNILDQMYNDIIKILSDSATACYDKKDNCKKGKKKLYVTGWNKHVSEAHRDARLSFQNWVSYGKPTSGSIYNNMRKTRSSFKSKLKWCQNNETQIKMDIIASHHKAKDFSKFWKVTNKLNPKPSVPVSVEGMSDPAQIATRFIDHFRVQSPLGPASPVTVGAKDVLCGPIVQIKAKEVAQVVTNMKRGKSPGHDSLSIEHLQHAGFHLPRVLAMFFSLCISHSYLPEEMIRTVVVPIIKNKTSDAASLCNYRPISLATVIAKVLDSVIDKHLEKYIHLHDAQFGFQAGLSTETAVLSLKHTVQYYTSRSTPIYACFLDLSKAFDLVAYDRLWHKLESETELPRELISLLKHWYSHQNNCVKWAGTLSDMYRLECGVRQGGLTSPRLFNLYIDSLVRELSSAQVGCSIDGVTVNNISYADDMVLLSPSISALRKLVNICERYAGAHGLKYNATKSELMVFKAGSKSYAVVPPVSLNGMLLKRVSHFKYLGHWVTEALADDIDMERERRALTVRANMLARRFARCSTPVKITLFKAYCQSFYTCSLWVKHTQKTWNTLRVQYNNAFRMLMGLPRFCSASGMFAETRVDGFTAILRKRTASLMRRVRGSANSILQIIAERLETGSDFVRSWTRIHSRSRASV